MLGLSRRLARSIAVVRTGIEVAVLVLGVLLGGAAGLGTLIYALGVGPAVGYWFRILAVQPPAGVIAVAPPPEAR